MDEKEKQYIEVIERNPDGVPVGTFAFWGKLTIDSGEGHTISINAPGYHENQELLAHVEGVTEKKP